MILILQVHPDKLRGLTEQQCPQTAQKAPDYLRDPNTTAAMADLGALANSRSLADTMDDSTPLEAQDEYLSYDPKANTRHHRPYTYDYYFDLLDFNGNHNMRDNLKNTIKNHIVNAEYKFLRYKDNVNAFTAFTSEFLRAHGLTYWGPEPTRRSHLRKIDFHKDFLCPRDAERPNSRLVKAIEALFNRRAEMERRSDLKKAIEKQLVPRIDFSKMTGLAADVQRNSLLLVPTKANQKRRAVLSDSDDDEGTYCGISPGIEVSDSKQAPTIAQSWGSTHDRSLMAASHGQEPNLPARYCYKPTKSGSVDLAVPDSIELDPVPYKGQQMKQPSTSQIHTSTIEPMIQPTRRHRSKKRQKDRHLSSAQDDCFDLDTVPKPPNNVEQYDTHASLSFGLSSPDEAPFLLCQQKRVEAPLAPKCQHPPPLDGFSHRLELLDSGPQTLTTTPGEEPLQIQQEHSYLTGESRLNTTLVSEKPNIPQNSILSQARHNVDHQQIQEIPPRCLFMGPVQGLGASPVTNHGPTSSLLLPRQSTAASVHANTADPIVIEDEDVYIKEEPISQGALHGTTLQVVDSVNQDRFPTPIPLASCTGNTSDRLFDACISFRGLSGKNVDHINVHFTWSAKKMSLQRSNTYLWDYFRKTIRKAWDSQAEEFEKSEDGCEIGMELHVAG